MKIFLFILILFLTSCSAANLVYMCGERECVDKKEANEYFEKNLSLEAKIFEKEKEKTFDLVKLNVDSVRTKSKKLDKKILSKLEKKRIKEEKRLAKIQIKKERERIKKEKKLFKANKEEEEEKSNVKKINKPKIKKITKKDAKFCILPKKCDIDEITIYLKKIGEEKDYPNLTKR